MKDNLTKEGFWDALYEMYPDAMQEFCDWIDEYKAENGWADLFKDGIKYHHLPIEMQIGLWIAFVMEQTPSDIVFAIDERIYDQENIYEFVSEYLRERSIIMNVRDKATQ